MDKSLKTKQLEDHCRISGLPLTIQRRTILEILAGREDHPTAEQIFEEVRHRIPEISKTTVYRVLETLVSRGVAGRAVHSGPAARFDALTEPHDHFLCVRCGKLVDSDVPVEVSPGLVASNVQGFEVLDCSVYFRGLCANCQPARTVNSRSGGQSAGSTRQNERSYQQ